MEFDRASLAPLPRAGDVITCYAYHGGAEAGLVLANLAYLLAGRDQATAPVLIIDWDLETPLLHQLFSCDESRGGLLELCEHWRAHLDQPHDLAQAQALLAQCDWRSHVQRVDPARPLYLMAAGRFDASYRERAGRLRWDQLFAACPALFRLFGALCAQHFRHVLVRSRGGLDDSVSICTTLLPDKLVGLFTPARHSVDGLAGTVRRAIDYRCSHEDEQRPLLVYPLAVGAWGTLARHAHGGAGYQDACEHLLRQCYGLSQICLDSYFDEVQLHQASKLEGEEGLRVAVEHGGDRLSLTRSLDTLLAWLEPGYFPWQSRAEIDLLARADVARAGGDERSAQLVLAQALLSLGRLYQQAGRARQALTCLEESVCLRQRLLGDSHDDSLASMAALAALLAEQGQAERARQLHESVLAARLQHAGPEHRATLAARLALAGVLAQCGAGPRALALHDELALTYARLCGPHDSATLAALQAQADTLARLGHVHEARTLCERVAAARARQLGPEHADTLASRQALALLLCRLDHVDDARQLQQGVLQAIEKQDGPWHARTLAARQVYARVLGEQGDLAGARQVLETIIESLARRWGESHIETLDARLELAAMLGQQGELIAARRIEEQVVRVLERERGLDDWHTLRSKNQLANTLWKLGERGAARSIEDGVLAASERLLSQDGCATPGVHSLREAILAARRHDSGDDLGSKISLVQSLLDKDDLRKARHLADSLREPLLRPGVAPTLRQRGMAVLRQMYQMQGDELAWSALQEQAGLALDIVAPGRR